MILSLTVNRVKLLKRLILLLLLLCSVAAFIAHKIVQRYGFDGIGDFIAVYRENRNLADQVKPDEMQLLISESDYAFLKERRDVAMERGIQINDGEENYVPCKIVQANDTIKGEIRLKGHMTDHLEGDKWSFRVKTKKKPVFGMTRFSLQAPGTRNYAYEWVYHELLKQEGIIHLNYDFIRLKLNEKDLGIYAIEEHFGQHVLEHNDRPGGAILRWNPNLYWEWRIHELQGTYIDEQYSNYASSFVEPYEKGTVENDSVLIATYQTGAAMLESFRRGEKSTSEIFDVDKMAAFHAIIDLVGGHHSLDWSDVKFFYNSQTRRVEPVGYESFSVRKTESVAGQRLPDNYDVEQFNYHNQLFADPIFFAAYIKALERICNESYFHNFVDQIQPELNKKLGILAYEFPYRKFTFDPYFENIELIRKNIQLPKPFHAFLEEKSDSTVHISLTPVSDFPIEILSLSIDGKGEYVPDSSLVLPARARNTYAHYFHLTFNHTAKKVKNLIIRARIPGSSTTFEVNVSDLPSYNQSVSEYTIKIPENSEDKLTWLNDTVSFFNEKEVVIDQVYFFQDTNHILEFFPGQRVLFLPEGKIITKGTLLMTGGSEDEEAIQVKCQRDPNIESSQPTNLNAHVLLDGGRLACKNVVFLETETFILASRAELFFMNCSFADISTHFLDAGLSELTFNHCASGKMNSLGTLDRSLLRMQAMEASNGDVLVNAFGSDIDITDCVVKKFNRVADLNYVSNLSSWSSNFEVSENIAILDNASFCRFFGGIISAAKVGFVLDQQTSLPGASDYSIYKTEASGIEVMEKRTK